jgi:sec-independent protein translocase protein TatB
VFSFTHIAIVFVIALLVFGPEKLPEVAKLVGKALGDFRRASTDFRRVIEQEFNEIERQTREKEEQARLKALEASNPAPAPAEGASPSAGPFPAAAPAGTIPNTDAPGSAVHPQETLPTPPDGHPA